ncbi:MAG TPA: CopD family protein [Streptosporangiaceae bacterium]|nr:CopD family protein [Streptosporangiaceae bacterium]
MTAAGSGTHAISRWATAGSWLRPWRRPTGYVVVLAGAAATGLAFGVWGDDRPRQRVAALDAPPPQTDPGALTAWGLPIVRLAVIVAVVGTVGMLAGALLLPREDGKPGAAALRCLRSAAWAAVAWAVAMVALLLWSWSDVRGIPVLQASIPQIFGPPAPYPAAVPYLYAAALALVIAGAAAITRTVTGVLVVLLLCGYNVLPLTTRDQQVDSSILGPVVTVHVLAIAVWVGGLAALLAHARRSPALLAVALPRFNRLAPACFVVVGAFGAAAAWINLGSAGALGASHFGTLVVYKAEALIALGVFGWWARRRVIADLRRANGHRPFVRFATIEVAVMVATLGLGSALTHTTAPAVPDPTPKIVNPYLGH